MSESTTQPAEQPATTTPKSTLRDQVVGGVVLIAVILFVGAKCLRTSSTDKATQKSETVNGPSASDSAEIIRASMLAEMKRQDRNINPWNAKALKYGSSEDWARAIFQDPWKEKRDGKGGRIYTWAGNGVVLIAAFNNGRCRDFQILDEEDVKALDIK